MGEERKEEPGTWTERIEVAGNELVERLNELVQEGNVRRLIIRSPKGDVLLEIPLTAGVAIGGAFTILAPVWAALAALAAALAKVNVEIVRVDEKKK